MKLSTSCATKESKIVKGEVASCKALTTDKLNNTSDLATTTAEDMLLLRVPAEQHHYWKKERGLHSIGLHCLGFC